MVNIEFIQTIKLDTISKPSLENFLIDNDYDCFSDYEDGIFEITSEQYNDFYRGKNISMTFQREVNVLYMLKKNEYYCFIHKSRSGSLTILNGGTMKNWKFKMFSIIMIIWIP